MTYVLVFVLGIAVAIVAYLVVTRGRRLDPAAGKAARAESKSAREEALRDTSSQPDEDAWDEFDKHYPPRR